jgi:hypothetical protein
MQVLISEPLDASIEKAAKRGRMSKGARVRHAIEEALERQFGGGSRDAEPLARLASLGAPTADIDVMIAEIESGWS